MSEGTSTTWKSLLAGFAAGVIATGVYFLVNHTLGLLLWLASLAYLGYAYLERKQA